MNKHESTRGPISPELTEIIVDEFEAMMRLTCIVYLRRECFNCLNRRLSVRLPEFLTGREHIEEETFDQFMRDMVVWTKERAEEEMKKPCSKEEGMEELSGIIIGVRHES